MGLESGGPDSPAVVLGAWCGPPPLLEGRGGAGSAFPNGICPNPCWEFFQVSLLCGVSLQVCPQGSRVLADKVRAGLPFSPGAESSASLSRRVEEWEAGWLLMEEEHKRTQSHRTERERETRGLTSSRAPSPNSAGPALSHPSGHRSSSRNCPEQRAQPQLPSMLSPQEDLTTPQSAAPNTLPTKSRVNGLQIIMRPAASASSLELCRWHPHTTLGRWSLQGLGQKRAGRMQNGDSAGCLSGVQTQGKEAEGQPGGLLAYLGPAGSQEEAGPTAGEASREGNRR